MGQRVDCMPLLLLCTILCSIIEPQGEMFHHQPSGILLHIIPKVYNDDGVLFVCENCAHKFIICTYGSVGLTNGHILREFRGLLLHIAIVESRRSPQHSVSLCYILTGSPHMKLHAQYQSSVQLIFCSFVCPGIYVVYRLNLQFYIHSAA